MSGQSFPPGYVPATDTPPSFGFNSKVMIAAIILLILVIFFILLLHVYAKWFLRRSSSRSISHTRHPGIAFLSRSFTFEPPIASAPAHINTGLDKATIAQLPTFVYKSPSPADNLEAGKLDESIAQQHPSRECAVCLSEFQENEEGRMLPSCKHTFHTECIDMWLFSHSTCPLCRAEVMLPVMENAQEAAPTHEQNHEGEEQEAMEASQGREGNSAVSNTVEYPHNGIVRVSPMDAVTSQEPSSPSLRSSGMPCARAVPQIAIDIPLLEGNVRVSASGPGSVSAKCITEDGGAGSSQLLKSPGFRASFRRMLSRQSSRRKSFTQQEGYEVSPK